MATIGAIRDGLAVRLATISGLRVSDVMPDSINPPHAIVRLDSATYDVAQGGDAVDYTFTIVIIASRTSERVGQDKLDGYLSPTGSSSIRAAIDADNDLGGVVDSCRAIEIRNYGTIAVGEVQYVAAEIVVEVLD